MHILVTGGAGYIGSHVVKLLLENTEHNITVIDNLSTGFLETIDTLQKIRSFNFVKLDLSDWDKLAEFFQNTSDISAIIHFAASLVVPESVEKPLKYYLNNTANTSNLLNTSIKYGINKFIFSSTAAVYGEPSITTPISEDFKTEPINPYGQSKLFVEKIIQDLAKAENNFKYVILRYFNVAGASPDLDIGQRTKNATHLVKVASETALGKRPKMYVFGTDYPTPDGTCIRDYIHVMDLADAHIKALEYLDIGASDIFNCGYGLGYSVKDVLNTMQRVSNNFIVENQERRAGDPAMLVADSSKIRRVMNWEPKYNSLDLICKTAYDWEARL